MRREVGTEKKVEERGTNMRRTLRKRKKKDGNSKWRNKFGDLKTSVDQY